jgi:hypothetical protein
VRRRLEQPSAIGRVLRDQRARNLDDFALQRPIQGGFDATRNQPRENFRCDFTQDFVCAFPCQPLHERIEYLVAQIAVVKDDALGGAIDDFAIDLDGFAQRVFNRDLEKAVRKAGSARTCITG